MAEDRGGVTLATIKMWILETATPQPNVSINRKRNQGKDETWTKTHCLDRHGVRQWAAKGQRTAQEMARTRNHWRMSTAHTGYRVDVVDDDVDDDDYKKGKGNLYCTVSGQRNGSTRVTCHPSTDLFVPIPFDFCGKFSIVNKQLILHTIYILLPISHGY